MNLSLELRISSKGIIEDIFSVKDIELNKEIQTAKLKLPLGKTVYYLKEKNFWDEIVNNVSPKLYVEFYKWINKYFFGNLEVDGVHNEKILCRCISYLEKDYINFLKENPSLKKTEISSTIQVGAGCGSCTQDAFKIYTKINQENLTPFDVALDLYHFIKRQKLLNTFVLKTEGVNVYLEVNEADEEKVLKTFFNNYPQFNFFINP